MYVSRCSHLYHEKKLVGSFQEMLENVFSPLFEATLHPEKYPNIHRFLTQVCGLCMQDRKPRTEGGEKKDQRE